MKKYFFLLLLLTVLNACSSTFMVGDKLKDDDKTIMDYSEFQKEIAGNNVQITLKNNNEITGKILSVSRDSISFASSKNKINSFSTKDVQKVVNKDHFMGGMIGLMGGGLLGSCIGAVSGSSVGETRFHEDFTLPLALVGSVAGAIIGFLFGEIIGYTNIYYF